MGGKTGVSGRKTIVRSWEERRAKREHPPLKKGEPLIFRQKGTDPLSGGGGGSKCHAESCNKDIKSHDQRNKL